MRIGECALLILGAGSSRRFGNDDKLAAMMGGRMLAHYILYTAASLAWSEKRFVSREDGVWQDAYIRSGFERLINRHPDDGIGSSLSIGIESLVTATHVLVCLADMPFITQVHLARLRTASAEHPDSVFATAAPSYRGPPAVFPLSTLKKADLQGDVGARMLIRNASLIDVSAREVTDIDDQETLSRMSGYSSQLQIKH